MSVISGHDFHTRNISVMLYCMLDLLYFTLLCFAVIYFALLCFNLLCFALLCIKNNISIE